jgi:hypothetical protein
MVSAVSKFREHICTDGCWICLALEDDEEEMESIISYIDDVREQEWNDRIVELMPWSKGNGDRSYMVSI